MSKLSILCIRSVLLATILMGTSPIAAALGLGNIDVQSGLGEPLRATIALEDATKSIESSCFKLSSNSDQLPPTEVKARISLRDDGLGNTRLLITSQQIFNDPIVNLTLIADCENHISREYVLLLDPPSFANKASLMTVGASDNEQQSFVTSNPDQAHVKPLPSTGSENSRQPQVIILPPKKPKKKPITPTPSLKAEIENSTISGSADSGESRLILSGSGDEYFRSDFIDAPLQLQMSFELKDWPTDSSQSLTEAEVSDEVTAMANRLAYLETQMTALQQRNQELENIRLDAKKLQSTDDAQNWATFMVYTFVTLVVIGFIGVAEWLRRRTGQRQIDAEVAIWEVLAPTEHLSEKDADVVMRPSADTEINVTPIAQAKQSPTKPTALPQQATQPSLNLFDEGIGATVNEDILEQAEVFVAHGRSNLAIVLLQDYLDEFPSSSPAPWLKLLDLLQKDGLAKEFEVTAVECKRHFNVALGDFHQSPLNDHSSIEDYPQVKEVLQQLWGTAEIIPFLDDLIFNRRRDDVIFNRKIDVRTGFKRGAYNEILFLRSIANEIGLTETLEDKPASPDFTQIKSEDFENTIVLPSPVEQDTTVDYLFSEAPYLTETTEDETLISTQLPEDKSTPLDFEFEFIRKRD